MTTAKKPTTWFWILGVLLLIWNAMGAAAYLAQKLMPPQQMAMMPEDQRVFLEMTPSWVTAAFALAVWGGLTASVLMLLRKAFAYLMFIGSLFGVLAQMFYNFVIAGAYKIYGTQGLVMPIIVLLIATYSIYFTAKSKAQGVLT